MTFSLHKSTAMTDIQATNNKSQALNVKGDTADDMASDGELNTPESSFSKLFSLFSSNNQTDVIVGQTAIDSAENITADSAVDSAVDSSVPNAEPGTVASLDDGLVAGLIDNADEAEAIVGDDLNVISQDDSLLKNESSDDFLARLDQSSMLLQSNTASDAGTYVQGKPNGNILPLQAKEANIASPGPVSITDLSTPDSRVAGTLDVSNNELKPVLQTSELSIEPTDSTGSTGSTDSIISTDTITASTLVGTSTVAGLTDNNPRFTKGDLFATGDLVNGDGTLDRELLGGAGKANLATGVSEIELAKNTPFGQASGIAAGISSAVTESNSSALEQLDMTSSEPIEQLDFAQIMESARKQEPLDQTTRTLVKTPILTDAEQQVLEKRVNLNNNLATSELNEKIAIMAGKELQTATIRLDPAELGSMNVKLVVQNDQINVTIQAQNNQSRDLLEQQMPRLREMLQQQGMTLGETQVQADSGQQQSAFQQSRQEHGQKNSNNEANYTIDSQTEVPVTTQYWQDSAKGVDFYA